jgi:UDP-N-acetyl-D-glucosamine dehydrogenase
MTLFEKIDNKTAKVAVVGLGYVGLPMAVAVARKGFKVLGVDVNQKAVDCVNAAENYIGDVDDNELTELVNNKMLTATSDYSKINDIDVIMVAVPTPLDKYQQPDSSFVVSATNSIVENVKPQTLVVLESTTYPGTTREIVAPAFAKKGFSIGEDIFIAFSPERVDPGNEVYKTANTPKVVGGMTTKCNAVSKAFYEKILDADVHMVSSPEIAEMEKIYENTFRNINIALANEMTILCDKMGIDFWEVIKAAKTKPYGFMAFYPGPGVGGHCIPIDPFYLTWKAREYKYHTRFIELSGEINNAMPEFVVEKADRLLNKKGLALSKSKILILGAAYKKDIKDLRESPIFEIMEILKERGVNFDYNDPYVDKFYNHLTKEEYQSVDLDKLNEYDMVIVVTNHTNYDYDMILEKSKLILDTRLSFNGKSSDNLIRL